MATRSTFLAGLGAAVTTSGCGGQITTVLPHSTNVTTLGNGLSLVVGRSQKRLAVVGSNKQLLMLSDLSGASPTVHFAQPEANPIYGTANIRMGNVTNNLPSGDTFRLHAFGMGEWKRPDGSYFRILDLQDGTIQVHAPSLGIALERATGRLSNAPFPQPVPKSLAERARKVQSYVNPADGSGDGSTPPPPTTSFDPYGDSYTNYGNGDISFTGGGYGPGAFDLSILYDDFGTMSLNYDMYGYNTAQTPRPRTPECDRALRDLNVAFLNFIGYMITGVMIARVAVKGGKVGKQNADGSWGDPPEIIAAIVDLQNKQSNVDTLCAGQGAGRNPYG